VPRPRHLFRLTAVIAVLLFASPIWAQSAITPGARVAIIGDSITEQKLYSNYVECYLLACSGVPDVKVMQFGWSGERADGFANRAENDLAGFKPTVATLCYGMNDGGYQPWKEEIGVVYERNMRNVLAKLEAAGVKAVVVGSPGAVDTDFFRPGQKMGDRPSHEAYNDTLAHLRDLDKRLAAESKQRFADVHAAMFDAMKKAKEVLGPKYDVCGGDGFHPGPNGQLLMAYAFLKGLGLDGNIGEIQIDITRNKESSKATDGHLVNGHAGEVGKRVTLEIRSTRWPFCFQGDGKTSGSTRSIVPFVPFNQDLNRLTLKVTGLETAKGKVTWGGESKEFTKDQLAAGVNLAAEFSRTPFDEAFSKLQAAVANKQGFETQMIKQLITNFRVVANLAKDDADIANATAALNKALHAHQARLDKAAREQLQPVKHTLVVEAVN
jgi:lysophospholipase L1-like esterase